MTPHLGHGINICQFGTEHGRCRCPSMAISHIRCPTPNECKPAAEYVPKHRKDVESDHD